MSLKASVRNIKVYKYPPLVNNVLKSLGFTPPFHYEIDFDIEWSINAIRLRKRTHKIPHKVKSNIPPNQRFYGIAHCFEPMSKLETALFELKSTT